MSKSTTLKDVLYALEYLHDAMVRVPAETGMRKAKWQMRASGVVVPEAIANEVRASGRVVVSSSAVGGRQEITWRQVA